MSYRPLPASGLESLVERVFDELTRSGPLSASDLRPVMQSRINLIQAAIDELLKRGWINRELIHAYGDLYRYVYSIARTKRAA